MVLEIARIRVKPDLQDGFAAAMLPARALLSRSPHLLSFKLMRGVEEPATFLLLIEWDSVAGHMEHTRAMPIFAEFRAILTPFVEAIEMQHFQPALYPTAVG